MAQQKEVMEAIQKLDSKLEKLDHRVDNIDKTLIKQEASLDKHIYRTEIAEENIEITKKSLRDLRKEMVPVQKHVNYMEGALKGLGILSVLAGLALAVAKLIQLL